ncbi:MAG TPA: hypothetical protein VN380_05605 [Thermoanaerobaculia bacterium]|jgi:hypothetical protein|nr:hypothetical protein [Thermoanaerobaculia bacterium]
MKAEPMSLPKLNLDFLEGEHLVGRLKLIELLEKLSPYRDLPERVERRFSQALQQIPSEFQEAVLAVFASTLYVTKQMLDDGWRFLWASLDRQKRTVSGQTDLFILELDRDLLRDEFFRVNALAGRLQDNLPWRSTNDLVDGLMNVEGGQVPLPIRESLANLLRRPTWLLLTDFCVSGTSAASDLERLDGIARFLRPGDPPTIIALIQLATEEALDRLRQEGRAHRCAITIPLTCALNSDAYSLIANARLVGEMRRACDWFASTHVLPTEYRIARMSREANNVDIARFGFGSKGWSVVTWKTAPNNSLPLLWFRPPGDSYRPPFERIDSRIGRAWPGRGEWVTALRADEDRANRLRKAMGIG